MKNNKLSSIDFDDLANTCLNIGIPHKMIPLFKVHRSLMYYPSPNLMSKYAEYYNKIKDYRGFFRFFHETKNCFWITKENDYYKTIINLAHEFNDKSTLVDILLYSLREIEVSNYNSCVLLYANELILKDRIYQKLFTKAEGLHSIIKNNCVGILFAKLIIANYQKLNNLNLTSTEPSKTENNSEESKSSIITTKTIDFDNEISLLISQINEIITKNNKSEIEILYNKEIKKQMIIMSGSEIFMKLDKRIISYMDSKMNVNIFEKSTLDINEIDKETDEPKIDVKKLREEMETEAKKLIEDSAKKVKKSKESSTSKPKTAKAKKEVQISTQTLYIARRTSKKANEKDKTGAAASKSKAGGDNKGKK